MLEAIRPTSPKLRIPNWLSQFLEHLCDFIEPLQGEARVGYDVRFVDPLWQIDLFLGKNELVGGSLDGLSDYVSYTANIGGILGLFSQVQRCEWMALPRPHCEGLADESTGLAIEGKWESHAIRIVLRMIPPSELGVGLRVFPNGSYAVA